MGDRYVVERMRRGGWNLGGEQSGHIVMTDYATTGDGLIAGLQFLAAMVETGQRASDLATSFDRVPQLLRNVRFGAGQAPLEAAAVKSGTEPLIRVMAECEDEALLTQVVDGIVAEVEAVAG